MTPPTTDERTALLDSLGASGDVRDELLRYCTPRFDWTALPNEVLLPLEAEPSAVTWQGYAEAAAERGVFAELSERLVQLRFPIREGITETDAYAAATRKGKSADEIDEATGLELESPETLELTIHPTPAGPVPVISCHCRADFVALVRALAHRNEPAEVPEAQGALMIAGLNNWDRVRSYREAWKRDNAALAMMGGWGVEFKRMAQDRSLYQDRLVLLDDHPYSGVKAEALGYDSERWRELSLLIRREHECVHYFTKRLLGAMHNNMHDEIIADYAGISAAAGRYRADWALRFVGLEDHPRYREGARLSIYRGDPALSDAAFVVLQSLVERATRNLERACDASGVDGEDARARTEVVAALTMMSLEQIGAEDGEARIGAAIEQARARLRWRD